MTALDRFKRVCNKYLIIENFDYVDVIFGVVMANRLSSKPVWLYLVGAPSSGKTEILQTLAGHPEIYAISKITIHTLTSGWTRKEGGKDCSLLPKLDKRILIIKDFTALLTMRYDAIHEILGLLREAYDGSVVTRYGTGVERHYDAKFGVIVAVTNIIDQYKDLLSDLGERFLTFRIPELSKDEERRRCKMVSSQHNVPKQEAELSAAAHRVLSMQPQIATITTLQCKQIISIAQFAARARCGVRRDRYTKEPELPQPEVATRLTKQLIDLSIGLAMARDKRKVTQDEVNIVRRMAIQSITNKRLRVIQTLLHLEECDVAALAEIIPLPEKAIRRELDDLRLVDLVDRRWIIRGKSERFYWSLKDHRLLKRILTAF